MAVEEGKAAPAFTLEDTDGNKVSLKDFKGRNVVVYFYPKDDTPGCTVEACSFRDTDDELADRGVVVLGISPDSVESHRAFREKYDLPFPLLADEDHAVAEAYGAWRERNLYGKRFMGIQRSTFLIDKKGRIAKVWKRVSPKDHARQVLAAIDALIR